MSYRCIVARLVQSRVSVDVACAFVVIAHSQLFVLELAFENCCNTIHRSKQRKPFTYSTAQVTIQSLIRHHERVIINRGLQLVKSSDGDADVSERRVMGVR